jgi:hypothetical protein
MNMFDAHAHSFSHTHVMSALACSAEQRAVRNWGSCAGHRVAHAVDAADVAFAVEGGKAHEVHGSRYHAGMFDLLCL